jgi:hypothetical protein
VIIEESGQKVKTLFSWFAIISDYFEQERKSLLNQAFYVNSIFPAGIEPATNS